MRLLVETSIAILVAGFASSALPQSISDYSHAQGALLEASMTQAAARAAALGASAVAPAASASSAPPAPLPSRTLESAETPLLVDGVFEAGSRALAEVTVDGRSYVLAVGQPVPGTTWQVAQISIDRVVLARPPRAGTIPRAPRTTTRTYALPAITPDLARAP